MSSAKQRPFRLGINVLICRSLSHFSCHIQEAGKDIGKGTTRIHNL